MFLYIIPDVEILNNIDNNLLITQLVRSGISTWGWYGRWTSACWSSCRRCPYDTLRSNRRSSNTCRRRTWSCRPCPVWHWTKSNRVAVPVPRPKSAAAVVWKGGFCNQRSHCFSTDFDRTRFYKMDFFWKSRRITVCNGQCMVFEKNGFYRGVLSRKVFFNLDILTFFFFFVLNSVM